MIARVPARTESCRPVSPPASRLVVSAHGLEDRLTGLIWHLEPELAGDPVSWPEALVIVASFGEGCRLPNVNELDSIVDCDRSAPALPGEYPLRGLVPGYWSSTTSIFEPHWTWAFYIEHGAIGVGQKAGRHFCVWPAREDTYE